MYNSSPFYLTTIFNNSIFNNNFSNSNFNNNKSDNRTISNSIRVIEDTIDTGSSNTKPMTTSSYDKSRSPSFSSYSALCNPTSGNNAEYSLLDDGDDCDLLTYFGIKSFRLSTEDSTESYSEDK